MTKKDYILIAETIQDLELYSGDKKMVAEALSQALSMDNPFKFNPKRFLDACLLSQ